MQRGILRRRWLLWRPRRLLRWLWRRLLCQRRVLHSGLHLWTAVLHSQLRLALRNAAVWNVPAVPAAWDVLPAAVRRTPVLLSAGERGRKWRRDPRHGPRSECPNLVRQQPDPPDGSGPHLFHTATRRQWT